MSFYSAPKEPQKPAMVVPTAPQSEPMASEQIQWTVPEGWKPLPAQEMRFAAFAVTEDQPPLVLTVTPLPPGAASVPANVNRWEQQLGLTPTPQADLGKVVTRVNVGDLAIDTVDLTGSASAAGGQQRMLGAILPREQQVWFFKLAGPAEKIAGQKAKFDAFIRSIRFASAAPAPVAGGESETPAFEPAPRKASWSVPAGWVFDPQPRMMREATFYAGTAPKQAEVVVSKLGRNFGDMAGNINRWRGQIGLEPLKDTSSEKAQKVAIGSVEGTMYDFAGPESAGPNRSRMLVAWAPVSDEVWFFKMTGPADVVGDQKPAFESFLHSVQFAAPTPEGR